MVLRFFIEYFFFILVKLIILVILVRGFKIKDCNLKNLVTKKPPAWGYINNISINFSSTFIREVNH